MFLEGTAHVFLLYLALAWAMCAPPYMGWWERVVGLLNRVEVDGALLAKVLHVAFPPLLAVAIVISHLYFFSREIRISFYALFMPSAFVVIPLVSAFYGIVAFAKGVGRVRFGDLVLLLFVYGGFGGAGTNIHDIIWCGRKTHLYTQFAKGGHDLDLWVEGMRAGTYDYRVFGFYMALQTLIFLVMAHIVFSRFVRLNHLKKNMSPIKWNWLATAFLAAAITLIDWPRTISPPLFHTLVIVILMVVSCAIFYRSGFELRKCFSEKKPDEDQSHDKTQGSVQRT